MTIESASEYKENIEPIYRLTFNLHYKGEEVLPKTQKQLTDGYIAYWDAKSRSVIFEAPDKSRILYQPEKGRSYFTKLTTMDFPVESGCELSLLMRLGVSELKVMLAVVTETYRKIHEQYDEYHPRVGLWPEDAENTMEKLRKEIAKHSA